MKKLIAFILFIHLISKNFIFNFYLFIYFSFYLKDLSKIKYRFMHVNQRTNANKL